MKLFSANIEDLRTLYISSLKKALDMEQKITEALPKMIEKSTDPDLTNAFQTHLQKTRGHVTKIESLLRNSTGEASTETCKVINGLTTEASDTMKDVTDPTVLNVALICAAQQVEHHEIAVYGTLRRRLIDYPVVSDRVVLSWEREFARTDGTGQLLAGGVLEQEAAGSGLHGVVDVLVEVEGGQHEDFCPAAALGELGGGLDAVESGHADVHQDNVRV